MEFIFSDIETIEPEANKVKLVKENRVISYDYLVIATGVDIHPEETEGMLGAGWHKNVFDFYTFKGASAIHPVLEKWEGGRLVMNVVENPIKCPVAPLEFLFLADDYFTKRGIRNKVELVYATPLSGAFTKPVAAKALGEILVKKNIHVETDYMASEVDSGKNILRSYDEREIPYDLLITVPVNKGADVIGRSGLGDDLNFVPTDKFTLQSKNWPNIWVLGDATISPHPKQAQWFISNMNLP